MKPKPTAKRRNYSGQQRRPSRIAQVRLDSHWQRRSGEEPPIAGASLAELEKRLNPQ
jgi:hypothetical protein